jgi:hypothetical protein
MHNSPLLMQLFMEHLSFRKITEILTLYLLCTAAYCHMFTCIWSFYACFQFKWRCHKMCFGVPRTGLQDKATFDPVMLDSWTKKEYLMIKLELLMSVTIHQLTTYWSSGYIQSRQWEYKNQLQVMVIMWTNVAILKFYFCNINHVMYSNILWWVCVKAALRTVNN